MINKNNISPEINIFDSFEIEFINSDKNPYGFSIVPPEWVDLTEKNHDKYLLIQLWDFKTRTWKDFLFDKNKNQISWTQRSMEVQEFLEIQEFDWYKVELRKEVNIKEELEMDVYKIYKWDKLVKTWETLANWILNTPETIYKNFLRVEWLKNEAQKKEEAYKNSSLRNRASEWFKMCWYYLREWEKFNIKEIREKREPEIDKMVNWMIEWIMELSDMSREDVIFRHFILDEESNKYVKTSNVEWIDISQDVLVENVWDLFYDSLSSFLDTLWDKISDFSKIEWELENQEKSLKLQLISENLKKASNHIMTAWQICLPYISHNFPVMKHTSEIKWIDISKEELAVKISKLEYEKLYNFLNKFSNKIHKDWLADEKRWRKKLSNELFEAAKLIKINFF